MIEQYDQIDNVFKEVFITKPDIALSRDEYQILVLER